jgi:TATA-box binding protein (TBP) (component of TFIID and TFIIIB)
MNNTIDQEWENFISVGYNETSDDEDTEDAVANINLSNAKENSDALHLFDIDSNAPKPTEIYISTKTKIAYLNSPIELRDIFWNIPVISYAIPRNGVIKKQMKFNSLTPEELHLIQEKLKNEPYFEEYVITHIDNPTGRIKFKDTRKISIGISKKDILSYRSKKKSAFYNCFVLILRMKVESTFKEFHVKVFNTGKLEIPGVQSETTFQLILQQVIDTIQPYMETKLGYKENSDETVLINSNFNCGYFINREALYDILKYKYNIQSIYDPCSYPGIQCKFYYNPDIGLQNGCQISEENKHLYDNIKEVSFMIFRTGSVLIVGRCDENVLLIIYEFLKNILNNEFKNICQKNIKAIQDGDLILKDKKKKVRRKNITIEMNCEL